MKKTALHIFSFICLPAILYAPGTVAGFELKSRYATIIYNSYDELDAFNRDIFLGKYTYLLKNENIITLEDEVAFKIDLIVDKVKATLHMFPDDVAFTVAICGSAKELQRMYEAIYDKPTDFIAFYSPRINTVYFSVSDVEYRIIAHEFAHIIMENFFQVSPPVKVHEILADYVEKAIVK